MTDPAMNYQTVTLVRSSWQQVEAIAPAAAALFYSHLFAADPGLRPLFKGDLQEQGDKLMQMIGAAVGKLDDLPALVPVLQGLAQRHAGYGVQAAHYDTVGAALLKTLDEGLGDDFTPPLRAAWREVYATIAEVMVSAAHRPEDAPGPAAAAASGVMGHERG
jgi:hemoglobin-like flavoprotein